VPPILPRNHDSKWKFTLEVHGQISGPVGQLNDGQNRIGGKLPVPVAEYQWIPSKDGKGGVVVDTNGKGCIVTPPNTTQFQCDEGAKRESPLSCLLCLSVLS
jgi:hypothetical protein